jgi:23S rRNA pseudouridine2604 synthase
MDSQLPSISLNKYISDTGICSRRKADEYIAAGKVKINGKVAQKGNRVFDNDKVTLDGRPLKGNPSTVYIALNKPPGITCTTDLKDPDNIIDYIRHPKRIFPIGRLDKASTGLILLTNEGNIVNQILRVENEHEKEYIVTVNQPITPDFLKRMGSGIPILGTVTKPCKIHQLSTFVFNITLTQGLNRQIRRMCEYLGYEVSGLKRIRIMNIQLNNIKQGEWRDLTEKELKELKASIATQK